jgi:hypothetical protein
LARGYLITGVAFLLGVLLLLTGSYLVVSGPDLSPNMRVDSAYNLAIDAQRALASAKDNAMSDALSDVASSISNCSTFDTSLLSTKVYKYFDDTVAAINTTLASQSLSIFTTSRSVTVISSIASETVCNFTVSLDARYAAKAGVDAQKSVALTATKRLEKSGASIKIVDTTTGSVDYAN